MKSSLAFLKTKQTRHQHMLRGEWMKWRLGGESNSLDAEEGAELNKKHLQTGRENENSVSSNGNERMSLDELHRGILETQVDPLAIHCFSN